MKSSEVTTSAQTPNHQLIKRGYYIRYAYMHRNDCFRAGDGKK